jgi:hypothetical protein
MVWDALANQKDDRARTELRKEFQRFVYPKGKKDRVSQPLLFSGFEGDDGFSADVSQVQDGDLAVLHWVGGKSSTGKKLADSLVRRRLYKRVFVLSVEKQAESQAWDRFIEFRRSTKSAWQKMLALQSEFQNRIISLVEQTDKPNVVSAVVTPDVRNKFLARRAEPLLLIDIPPVRKKQEGLEYLIEEDRRRYKVDELKTGHFEKSSLWTELQHDSRGTLAKIRVFCDPEFSEFLTSYLTHTQIEVQLQKALDKVDTE